ncbi:MAG: PD40 domain-containing protein [Candidatus Latescibacterota bacterium]|nr:MAG: PD40 domain-containing protein [Candidatus Latescibacterota bacterium]
MHSTANSRQQRLAGFACLILFAILSLHTTRARCDDAVQMTFPTGDRSDSEPAWSTAGDLIAFTATDIDFDLGLVVSTINVITGTAVPQPGLFPGQPTGTNAHASWSPDGAQIAYAQVIGPSDRGLVVHSESMSGGTRIVEGLVLDPDWSPVSDRIVYTRFEMSGGDSDLWIVSSDGSNPTQLTSGPANDAEPAWSPDATTIAFSSDRSGNRDLWLIPSAGGTPTRLTTNASLESTPAWSPDGRWIAFGSNRDGPFQDIWIVRVSTGVEMRVTDDFANDVQPEWSPDGQRIVFRSGRSGNAALFRIEVRMLVEVQSTTMGNLKGLYR